jgi:hypothetical protein
VRQAETSDKGDQLADSPPDCLLGVESRGIYVITGLPVSFSVTVIPIEPPSESEGMRKVCEGFLKNDTDLLG